MRQPPSPPPERGLFCNRTLNMRAIKAIGYDMDYTLIHYRVEAWEQRAYEHMRDGLVAEGLPVGHLRFDPQLISRGLIIDTEKGNLLKANRFGYVRRAVHGTRELSFEQLRDAYARTIVDLHEPRWVFLNTLFSLSEACLYIQLVDLLDTKALTAEPMGYQDLYERVRVHLDAVHMAGQLKAEIVANPDAFVLPDPDTVLALLDQRHAGKKLLLITNSEWSYTSAMMRHAFDPYMPRGMTWRQLFDVVIVAARKPDFFTSRAPLFEVVDTPDGEGLLRPTRGALHTGTPYYGGSAVAVERSLGLSGDEILYVGDHMFGDVHVSKDVLRWRTALVLRELEDEVRAIASFRATEARLAQLMAEKERLEAEACQVRLAQQRRRAGYGPPLAEAAEDGALHTRALELRARLEALDAQLGPMARASGELNNPHWGLLTRAGNDKSHLARQVERYADIYTSRVSNFLYATPFVYLRSPRGSLPHDPTLPGGAPVFQAGDGTAGEGGTADGS